MELLAGQITDVKKENEVIFSKQDKCNEKVTCFKPFLSCHRDACNYVAKRLRNESVCIEVCHVVAASNSED